MKSGQYNQNIPIDASLGKGAGRVARFTKAQQKMTQQNKSKPLNESDVVLTIEESKRRHEITTNKKFSKKHKQATLKKASLNLKNCKAANCHVVSDKAIGLNPQLAKKMVPSITRKTDIIKKATTTCQQNLRHGDQAKNARINELFDPEFAPNGKESVRTLRMINLALESNQALLMKSRRGKKCENLANFNKAVSPITPYTIIKSRDDEIITHAHQRADRTKLNREFPELAEKASGMYTATSSSTYRAVGNLFFKPSEKKPVGHLVKRRLSGMWDSFERYKEVEEARNKHLPKKNFQV
jgi:hypothetical protein